MEIVNVKNQSEMKNTVTKMKTTLQRINNTAMKQRTESAIWKIRKQKIPIQNSKKKKEFKKMRIV